MNLIDVVVRMVDGVHLLRKMFLHERSEKTTFNEEVKHIRDLHQPCGEIAHTAISLSVTNLQHIPNPNKYYFVKDTLSWEFRFTFFFLIPRRFFLMTTISRIVKIPFYYTALIKVRYAATYANPFDTSFCLFVFLTSWPITKSHQTY